MKRVGPTIEQLTRRLAETPSDFLEDPLPKKGKTPVNVAAVVSDLLVGLGGPPLDKVHAKSILGITESRHLTTSLIACWLLHDEWFRDEKRFAPAARKLILGGELVPLSKLVDPRLFVTDPDRREEFARICLAALELRPAGESIPMARDRLTTLSTIERERVIRETKEAKERMKQIQEEMRRKAAQEAAPAWGRE